MVASLLFWGFANSVLYSVPRCCGAFTPSTRRRVVGGLFFDVEAVRTEASRDGATPTRNHESAGRLRQRGQEVLPALRFVCERRVGLFGQFVRIVSKLRAGAADPAAAWGLSFKLLMGGVVASGGVLLGAYEYMQRQVVTDPRCVDPTLKKVKDQNQNVRCATRRNI